MSIADINERLLRTIGIGVALVRDSDLGVVFYNASFAEWFGDPGPDGKLTDILTELDAGQLAALRETGERFTAELTMKPKRRTLVFSVEISMATTREERILVIECQNITRMRELENMIDSYSNMVERNTRELEREKERAERLLLNVMPRSVYEEFKTFGVVTPQLYENVSVVMLDFVGFTEFSAKTDPTITLGELNDMFTTFDRIVEQFGCERIKTIGDAYLAVSGMPEPSPDHATAVAHCAVRFLRYLERRNESHQYKWQARIGLASGAAVGSVVGIQKYVYDVFGPSVNTAARLQVFAKPMKIVAPADMTYALIDEFQVTQIGAFEIKGLGEIELINVSGDIRVKPPVRY